MRTYVDNIIALIFSLTHVLSLSISLYIIYSYNDFSVTFENSSVNWNFGPASIFAVTLYFANYIIASIYRLKSSKKRNVVEFVPIAAVLIYIYFNVDFDLSAFLKVIGSIDETNFASLTLTIIMLFLSLPYFFGVYSRNIAINPLKYQGLLVSKQTSKRLETDGLTFKNSAQKRQSRPDKAVPVHSAALAHQTCFFWAISSLQEAAVPGLCDQTIGPPILAGLPTHQAI